MTVTDEFIGKTIGGYEILGRLGVGGMATVYRARQSSMNRIVALKILPRHFMRDDSYLARFEREVKIVATLEHRSIVPVFDYGEYDGQPYIVMRYMPGGSVDDLLAAGPLSQEQILHIVEQIAPALDYAHSKNVLHRDLKPSNILLDDAGGAYITDFGIARILGSQAKGDTITTQGVVGTPSYMSPEQAQGHELDGRSDVYALGVMLFEMATGRRPFENDTPYSIAVMQVTTPPPSPRTYNTTLSGTVEEVILKALKKKRENRYSTAVELATALKLAVERPTSVHDTRPTNLRDYQNAEGFGATQPAGYMPREPQPQPQVILPQPVPYTTPYASPMQPSYPPASAAFPPVPTDSGINRVLRRRPRRGSVWISILIGGLIGCALLSVLVVAGIVVATTLLNDSDALPGTGGSRFATLDPTSEAARNALIPGVDPNTTQVFVNATPIPTFVPTETRPTATRDEDGEIEDTVRFGSAAGFLYFAERDNNFDLYLHNLDNGSEFQITESEAVDSYPQLAPDGWRVVFQSDRDGDFDLYLIDLDGRNLTRLTDNAVTDRLPAWSPDGQWIVYSSDTRGDGNYDLVRLRVGDQDAASEGVDVLLSNEQRNSHPRYSPDGRTIVFTTGDANDAATWEIATLDLLTGEVVILTDNTVRDASPSVSPDGETILYVTEGEGGAAIVQLPLDGAANPRVVYDGAGYEWGMSYTADGSLILFNSELDGISTIYQMTVGGGDVRPIETSPGGYYPSWVRSRS